MSRPRDGEPGQLLEQETALAPAAEPELADQLLVSGLLAGGGSDPRHQFPIGHTPRLRQLKVVLLVRVAAQEIRACRRMGERGSWRSREIDSTDCRQPRRWPRRVLQRRADLHFFAASLWTCLGIPGPQRTEKEETLSAMWKPSQTGSTSPTSSPEPPRAAPPAITPETPARLQAGSR